MNVITQQLKNGDFLQMLEYIPREDTIVQFKTFCIALSRRRAVNRENIVLTTNCSDSRASFSTNFEYVASKRIITLQTKNTL